MLFRSLYNGCNRKNCLFLSLLITQQNKFSSSMMVVVDAPKNIFADITITLLFSKLEEI
jgi:hypothetical protein